MFKNKGYQMSYECEMNQQNRSVLKPVRERLSLCPVFGFLTHFRPSLPPPKSILVPQTSLKHPVLRIARSNDVKLNAFSFLSLVIIFHPHETNLCYYFS